MKKVLYIIILLIILLLSYICYTKIGIQSGNIKLLINNNKVTLRKVTNMDSLSTNITIKNINKKTIIINNKRIKPGKTITFNLDKLGKKIKVNSINKKYIINTIPSDFPEYKITGKSHGEGNYTLTFNKDGIYYMSLINPNGELLFYKKSVYKVVGNFKQVSDNRYSYIYTEKDINDVVYHNNYILLDENFNEIDNIKYDESKDIGIDVHDAIYIEDGHYIISTSYPKVVNNFPTDIGNSTTKVEACFLKEVKDGRTIWEFDSTDYTNLYGYYNPDMVQAEFATTEYYRNYMHFNSMVIDPKDNNLIVSFRNICALIKIDRNTGKIIWILGGKGDEFNLSEEEKFLFQHSVTFGEGGKLLLYDNGNKERKSRIVTFYVDEKNKKISDYVKRDLGASTTNWGTVKYLGDSKYLVNYGLLNDLTYNRLDEIDINTGEVNFSIDFDDWFSPNTYKYRGGL